MIVEEVMVGIGSFLVGGVWVYFVGTRMIKDFSGIVETNKLHRCARCKRYARKHQMELAYWQAKLKGQDPQIINDVCPHCGKHSSMFTSDDNYAWLKTNPDCFEINFKHHQKNKAAIRKVKQGIEDLASMKAFMEYHDLKEATPQVMKKMKEEVKAMQPVDQAAEHAAAMMEAWAKVGVDLNEYKKNQSG